MKKVALIVAFVFYYMPVLLVAQTVISPTQCELTRELNNFTKDGKIDEKEEKIYKKKLYDYFDSINETGYNEINLVLDLVFKLPSDDEVSTRMLVSNFVSTIDSDSTQKLDSFRVRSKVNSDALGLDNLKEIFPAFVYFAIEHYTYKKKPNLVEKSALHKDIQFINKFGIVYCELNGIYGDLIKGYKEADLHLPEKSDAFKSGGYLNHWKISTLLINELSFCPEKDSNSTLNMTRVGLSTEKSLDIKAARTFLQNISDLRYTDSMDRRTRENVKLLLNDSTSTPSSKYIQKLKGTIAKITAQKGELRMNKYFQTILVNEKLLPFVISKGFLEKNEPDWFFLRVESDTLTFQHILNLYTDHFYGVGEDTARAQQQVVLFKTLKIFNAQALFHGVNVSCHDDSYLKATRNITPNRLLRQYGFLEKCNSYEPKSNLRKPYYLWLPNYAALSLVSPKDISKIYRSYIGEILKFTSD